jgi:uncharacterized protein (TIGR03435 family)
MKLVCVIFITFLAALCGGIASPTAHAQTSEPPAANPGVKPLEFDVVSIKPNKTGTTMIGEGVIGHFAVTKMTRDGFSSANVTAKSLIATAYGLREYLISGGPSWIESTRYDIEAKVADFNAVNSLPPAEISNSTQLTKAQRSQMIRSLLTDRFKLAAHYDTKDAPIYELVIDKGGSKLQEFKLGDADHNQLRDPELRMTNLGHLAGQEVTAASLVDTLSQLLQYPVVDKTGLTGKYVINLQYTPDTGPATDSPDSTGTSIFTALQQQLGLTLASTKGPVKTLVIDHIEQPSEK